MKKLKLIKETLKNNLGRYYSRGLLVVAFIALLPVILVEVFTSDDFDISDNKMSGLLMINLLWVFSVIVGALTCLFAMIDFLFV